MKKAVKKYTTLFNDALKRKHITDHEEITRIYANKLSQMYHSEQFKVHDVYTTMDIKRIYAVIAMCLTLKDIHFEKDHIIDFVNYTFRKQKKTIRILLKIIDVTPWAYKIAKNWNINDHKKRMEDGSILYDFFKVDDGRIEYCISKCMYAEIFEYYGIRELCKIFCITDIEEYAGLIKHVNFTRYSDLSDGKECHDIIVRR